MSASSQNSSINGWSCSSGSHTTGDLRQIQEMKNQNMQLQTLVAQLQGSLDSTNNQLRTALTTATTASQLQDEVNRLKQKLKETEETASKKQKHLTQQIVEITKRTEEEKAALQQVNENQTRDIQKISQSYREVKKDRDALVDEVDELKQQLRCTLEQTAKIAKQKTKAKKQVADLSQQLSELDQKYNSLLIFHEQTVQESKAKDSEIDQLKDQITQLKTDAIKLNDNYLTSQREKDNYQTAVDVLQQQMESQKGELNELTEEREKFLLLIQKLHSIVCVYEDELETAKTQNIQLKDKSKKTIQPNLFAEQFNIESITFPFDDSIKKRINTILSYDHFQSTQKIQLIINEIAKDISKLKQQCTDLSSSDQEKSSSFNDIKTRFQKLYDIIHSIEREWKNLECNEKGIDVIAFCEKDEAFLNFVAEQCVKLEELPKMAEFLGPLFVTTDIFSDEAEPKRRELINEVAANNKDLSILISALFLINNRLKKQVSQLLSGSGQKSEINNVINALGVEHITDVPSYIEDLQNKVTHLKSTRKEVHNALIAARDAIESKEATENKLNTQVQALQQTVSDLQKENDSLKKQIESLKNFNAALTAQNAVSTTQPVETTIHCDISHNSQSSIESDSEFQSALRSMQEMIQNKSKEILCLKDQISQLQQENQQIQQAKINKYVKREQALRQQIKDLEDALSETTTNLSKTKKRAKNTITQMKARSDADYAQLSQNFEKTKTDLQQELTDAKERAEKAQQLIHELQESLSQADKRNKDLADEKQRISKSLQTLESNVNSVQEKYVRDQKSAQAAFSVKLLNIETQHQKETKELKMKLEAEKQNAIEYFTKRLGALYGIVDLDNDEASLNQLFNRLQSDIGKLKYFQTQATKY